LSQTRNVPRDRDDRTTCWLGKDFNLLHVAADGDLRRGHQQARDVILQLHSVRIEQLGSFQIPLNAGLRSSASSLLSSGTGA
jgi:hypothetical protein